MRLPVVSRPTASGALRFATLPTVFATPDFAARFGEVLPLADRIKNCFLHPMNEKALPVDSDDMTATIAYMD